MSVDIVFARTSLGHNIIPLSGDERSSNITLVFYLKVSMICLTRENFIAMNCPLHMSQFPIHFPKTTCYLSLKAM